MHPWGSSVSSDEEYYWQLSTLPTTPHNPTILSHICGNSGKGFPSAHWSRKALLCVCIMHKLMWKQRRKSWTCDHMYSVLAHFHECAGDCGTRMTLASVTSWAAGVQCCRQIHTRQTWPNYYINNTALYVWVMITNQLYLTLSSTDKCVVNGAYSSSQMKPTKHNTICSNTATYILMWGVMIIRYNIIHSECRGATSVQQYSQLVLQSWSAWEVGRALWENRTFMMNWHDEVSCVCRGKVLWNLKSAMHGSIILIWLQHGSKEIYTCTEIWDKPRAIPLQLSGVWQLLYTSSHHISPFSTVVTTLSIFPLLTDVPFVDYTLIL